MATWRLLGSLVGFALLCALSMSLLQVQTTTTKHAGSHDGALNNNAAVAVVPKSLGWRGLECFPSGLVENASELWAQCRRNRTATAGPPEDAPGSNSSTTASEPSPSATQPELLQPIAVVDDAADLDSDPSSRVGHCPLALDPAVEIKNNHTSPTGNARCLVWKRGAFAKPRLLTSSYLWQVFLAEQARRPSCTVGAALAWGELKPSQREQGRRWRAAFSEHCTLDIDALSLLAVLHVAALNGTRSIVISGDSMMRQFFMRIVFLLRERALVIEQHGWFDITYVLHADGDELQYRVPSKTVAKKVGTMIPDEPRLRCIYDDPIRPCLLQLQFLWEPYDDLFDRLMLLRNAPPESSSSGIEAKPCLEPTVQFLTREGLQVTLPARFVPSVHVHASMYWFSEGKARRRRTLRGRNMVAAAAPRVGKKTLTDVRRFFGYFERLATAAMNVRNTTVEGCESVARVPYHFFSMLTPGLRSANMSLSETRNSLIRRRNSATIAALQRGAMAVDQQRMWPAVDLTNQSSMHTLNFPAMLQTMPIAEQLLRSKDSKHFMCTFLPPYPRPINTSAGDDRGCVDDVNAAMVQWWASALLSMRV